MGRMTRLALKPFSEIQDLMMAGDAPAAEAAAREWLAARGDNPTVVGNVGGVLIDIGQDTGSSNLVEEGIALTRRALEQTPVTQFKFNLANGLSASHPATPEDAVSVRFEPRIAECTSLYYEAIDESSGKPEARFNLVSALAGAGRAVEAVDLARETLADHPLHGPGWASLGDALWSVWSFYGRFPGLLQDTLAAYRNALELELVDRPFRAHVGDCISRVSGLLAAGEIRTHSHRAGADGGPSGLLLPPVATWDSGLPAFVCTTDLGLNLCSGCRAETSSGYDRFPLGGVLIEPGKGDEVQVRLAGVNLVIQGFMGARALLWLSRADEAREVEITSWPVAGLAFTRRTAFLNAAFREAYGVLDRISALLAARLGIDGRPSFAKLFFEKSHGQLSFRNSNPWPDSVGLRALLYLSASFETGKGRFNGLRELRNDLQHSLVLPGRLDANPSTWRTIQVDELESETVRMLRLTRAATLYCCEGLRVFEADAVRAAREAGATIRSLDAGKIHRE